jgi:O-antigen/teichoic acid export membrane protein
MPGSVTQNSFILLGSKLISLLISICSGVIIARALGPEGKGILSIAFLVPTLICTFFVFDSGVGIRYYLAKKPDQVGDMVKSSFVCGGLLGITLVLLFYLTLIPFHKLITQRIPVDILSISILLVPFMVTGYLFSAVLSGLKRFFTVSVIGLADIATYTVLILVLSQISLTTKGVVISKLATSFAIALIFVTVMWKGKLITRLATVDGRLLKDIVKYGLKSYPGTIAQFLSYRFDFFLVAYFLSFAQVGLYALAVSWSELLFYLPDSMAMALFPAIASSRSIKDSNELTAIMTKAVMIIMFVGSIFIFLFAGKLIPLLYTDKFLNSIYPLFILLPGVIMLSVWKIVLSDLFILLPGVIMLSVWKIVLSDLAGRGFPQYKSISSTIGMVSNVVLNIVLIPLYGINGASLATTVSYSLTAILAIYWFTKTTGTTLRQLLLVQLEDLTLILSKVARRRHAA